MKNAQKRSKFLLKIPVRGDRLFGRKKLGTVQRSSMEKKKLSAPRRRRVFEIMTDQIRWPYIRESTFRRTGEIFEGNNLAEIVYSLSLERDSQYTHELHRGLQERGVREKKSAYNGGVRFEMAGFIKRLGTCFPPGRHRYGSEGTSSIGGYRASPNRKNKKVGRRIRSPGKCELLPLSSVKQLH